MGKCISMSSVFSSSTVSVVEYGCALYAWHHKSKETGQEKISQFYI